MTATANQPAPLMVFTTGTPGAGKTYVIRRLYPHASIIDCDAVKATHPDYNPKDPGALHDWSKTITDRMFSDACDSGAGVWIYDGTGTNPDRLVARMQRAANAGFQTVLVYVRCSLETSLRRNAARARNVPEHIVREKAESISSAFVITRDRAHRVFVIENDIDGRDPLAPLPPAPHWSDQMGCLSDCVW